MTDVRGTGNGSDKLTAEDIRSARLAASWSVTEACREMKRRSSEPLPTLASLVRAWKRWEAGTVGPSPRYRLLIADLFADPQARAAAPDLVAPPPFRTARPTVWRRWLAFELRRLRHEASISQREAARSCGWTTARLAYVENVQQGLLEDDLEKLLTLYRVPTDRWGAYFKAAADGATERGWWARADERVEPEWLSLFVGLEQGAARIRSFEPSVIPGLLQTADYAAAVLSGDFVPRTRRQIDRLVEARLARQAVLTRQPRPLELSAIVDEAALRRLGGDPAVMAAQLHHLIALAERPNVTLQVLPFEAGTHSYTFGAFMILDFPWATDPGVVYVEHRNGAVYLEEPHAVEAHALVFQHLDVLAHPPDESLAIVRDIAEEYA